MRHSGDSYLGTQAGMAQMDRLTCLRRSFTMSDAVVTRSPQRR